VHDRRANGEALTFGNRSQLYKLDMTWWDHKTGSVWTQLLGEALLGPLAGTRLEQLPAFTGPWQTWRCQHPDTLVLEEPDENYAAEDPKEEFIVGVARGDFGAAFYFLPLAAAGAINETVDNLPILAVAVADTRVIRIFSRTVDDRLLTFDFTDGLLTDRETGTIWDPFSGAATAGPLAGRRLAQVPHTLSFDWAWQIFYPTSTYFPGYGQWETAPG
jgi:hypothetical protein